MSDIMIEAFKTIQNEIKRETREIVKFVSRKEVPYGGTLFEAVDVLPICSSVNKLKADKSAGVYVFRLLKDYHIQSVADFNSVDFSAQLKDSGLTQITLTASSALYLGKSENSVNSRLNEHLTHKAQKTYSLKLSVSQRKLLLSEYLEVYRFYLKEEYINYKKIILSTTEGYLHEALTPLIGSSKTT